MSDTPYQNLLDALLDSWDRNNTILVNLLSALPESAMEIRATESSPTIAELFTHMHFVRLIFVLEDAPEFAAPLPEKEWVDEHDRTRIAQMLQASAITVREAVQGRLASGRAVNQQMDQHYDHPILLLQHMIWHEGYHHGQIKLALKAAGLALDDDILGPLTWGIWMHKT
jgi:uncharacterized damage-inducible protein DinB